MRDMPIGTLAKRTGVKVPTIRYYESIGLLGRPVRSASNRRLYGEAELRRLAFLRHARDLGFEIEAIRQLLDLADQPDRPCAEADAIARGHLVEVERKIAQLTALRTELKRMVEECGHGRICDCRVIEVLADHAACASDRH
jgi:DNA-binding transcriptional MerR regulator